MDVKQITELEALMNDFYGSDATVSQSARDELINYGRDLIRANQLEDYQALMDVCASVIADKGIDVTPAERVVIGGRAQEGSLTPAPIQLMRDFEEQARTELGELTEGADAVRQTREIVEKLASVLSRQREIIEKIQRDPSSIEKFVAAIDRNNELSQKQIANEEDRLKHFREYFPDEDAISTINPTNSTYKLSQYDKVHRADMQVQLLEDLKTTIAELEANEAERAKFQANLEDPENPDPDARDNIAACERKAKALKEKISKIGPDGRETGLIQRLKDFGLDPKYVAKLDIDKAESYTDKGVRIGDILKDVRKDRATAYAQMAKTVVETLDAKGVVDPNSSKYPESKRTALRAKIANLLGGDSKKSGPSFGEEEGLSEEELEASRKALKDYVEYVKQDIQKTQDRIDEYESAIEFRNETKAEIERQREAMLDETIVVGEGDDARRVVARDQIEADAQAQAEHEFRNPGRNGFTRFWRNVGFFFTHGFRSRDRMIAERAESLIEANSERHIQERRDAQVASARAEGDRARRSLNGIETISREARNDESVHSAAHNAAANITKENILSGKGNRAVDRAETVTAGDLSDMGYDIALQRWRNGEMSQADFDRILKEHLENPDRKDRYVSPDETKGYKKAPEYRNPEHPEGPDRD